MATLKVRRGAGGGERRDRSARPAGRSEAVRAARDPGPRAGRRQRPRLSAEPRRERAAHAAGPGRSPSSSPTRRTSCGTRSLRGRSSGRPASAITSSSSPMPTAPTLDAAQLGRFVLEGRMDGLLVAFATIADEFVAQIAGRGLPLVPINSRSAHRRRLGDDGRRRAAAGWPSTTWSRSAIERIGFLAGRADTDVGRRREAGLPGRDGGARTAPSTRRGCSRATSPSVAAGTSPQQLLDRSGGDASDGAVRGQPHVRARRAPGGRVDLALRVPDDLSVVTMDDHPILEHIDPPLTAIHMPMDEMGDARRPDADRRRRGATAPAMRHGDRAIPGPPRLVDPALDGGPADRLIGSIGRPASHRSFAKPSSGRK